MISLLRMHSDPGASRWQHALDQLQCVALQAIGDSVLGGKVSPLEAAASSFLYAVLGNKVVLWPSPILYLGTLL